MNKYAVMKEIHFCYGHRLLKYRGKCRHLHGHNALVQIELEAKKCDSRGMVVDFGDIENIFHQWIETHLDHKMLLNKKDPLLKEMKKWKQPVYEMKENPTAEAIARLLFEVAKKKRLPVKEVRLWETPTSYASYRNSN